MASSGIAEPVVQEDLYELVVTAKIEDALYLTGVMVMEDKISELENVWIRACAGNELKTGLPSPWKWRDIISDTYNITKSEAFKIADALLLTTKQCLFYKELLAADSSGAISIGGGKKPMVHIKHLRNVILEDFPDSAMLSDAGIKRYRRIIPTEAEEQLFAHRILSGLSRLWTEKQHEKSRDALEYLSRRRLSLQLPDRSWPAPNPEASGDFIWFLWGAVLCYFQHADIVYKIFFLFNREAKKNRRQQRFGLLWHIGYVVGNAEGSPWTIDENRWLAYIKENAADIWGQIRSTQEELKETERALKKASGHASPAEDFDEIFGFVPRTTERLHVPAIEQKYYPMHAYSCAGGLDSSTGCGTDEGGGQERKIKVVGVRSIRDPQSLLPSIRKLE